MLKIFFLLSFLTTLVLADDPQHISGKYELGGVAVFRGLSCPCTVDISMQGTTPINVYILDSVNYENYEDGHGLYPVYSCTNMTTCAKDKAIVTTSKFFVVMEPAAPGIGSVVLYSVTYTGAVGCLMHLVLLLLTYWLALVGLVGLYYLFFFLKARRGAVPEDAVEKTQETVPLSGVLHIDDNSDAYVTVKDLIFGEFTKPEESFKTWWKHEHYWTWPWFPYRDEVLARQQRIMILVLTVATNMLITTVWKPTVDGIQSSFSHDVKDLQINYFGHLLALAPVVSLAKIVMSIGMYYLFYFTDKRIMSDWKWLGRALNFVSVLVIVTIFILIMWGLLQLAASNTCSHLFQSTVLMFFLVELLDSCILFPVRAGLLYKYLSWRGTNTLTGAR